MTASKLLKTIDKDGKCWLMDSKVLEKTNSPNLEHQADQDIKWREDGSTSDRPV